MDVICSSADGSLLRLPAHLHRLRRGLTVLGFRLAVDDAIICNAAEALLQANALSNGRLTVTRGNGPRGLLPPSAPEPIWLLTASAATDPPTDPKAITVQVRRNEGSPLSHCKTLGYGDQILARQQAHNGGADEALMRNNAGNIVCTSSANLFLSEGDTLVTPPLTDGALPGIVRAQVIERASQHGWSVLEESVSPNRLAATSQAFITNSLIGAVALTQMNVRSLSVSPRVPTLSELAFAQDQHA